MAYNFDDEILKYYTQKLKEKLAEKDEIPTKTSDLTNDNGFITIDEVPKTDLTDYQTKSDATLTTTNKTVVGAINELEADSHTHTNKDILDAITSEKITSWNNKAEVSNIPTKTSDLTNDSGFLTSIPSEYITETELDNKGYLTEHQDISNKADKSEIPTKTSQLQNDSGYLTSIPSEYVTETELASKGYLTEHQSLEDYALKTEIPSVPTKTSQLTNDSNFISVIPSEYVTETELNAKGYATKTFVTETINNVEESSHTHSNKELLDSITADNIHTHINKGVIDAITSDMTTKWNKSIPFENSYVSNCNEWLTNGYTKTSTSTTNHPSVCTGADRWGVLFYISENAANGTGTQMYFPIDGTYAGRVFTRQIVRREAREWNLLSTFDGNYNNLTNKPTIPTNVSQLTNDSGYITSIPSEYITESELNTKGYLTEHQDISGKADKSEIPTKTSQLTNDSNFISSIPSEYITETELNAKGYLTEIPSEYVTESELNTKGYLTEHQDISGKADKLYVDTELAKKSDKTHTHSYNDLSDKPVIPSIDGLATKKELTDGLATKSNTTHTHDQYLTEHQDLSNYALKTEIPTVPTKTSQLTNDSGFITSIPSEYITETELNAKGYLTSVPSEYVTESELNTKGYLTEHQDISNKADKSEIPTKTSQLENDSNFATQPNFTFEINMIASTEQPNVVTNGTYPNLVVTFNIPQGAPSSESRKPIYYGRLSISEVGGSVVQYNSITDTMIKNGANITKITSQTLDRTSVGKQSETSKGDYIIVAVPNDEGYIVKKDNGLGGKIMFDKDVAGANGVILNIDGNEYAIYGEILISPAEIFIYIDKN